MCICSMYIKHQKIISKTIFMSDVQNLKKCFVTVSMAMVYIIIFSRFDQTDNLEFQYDFKDIPQDEKNRKCHQLPISKCKPISIPFPTRSNSNTNVNKHLNTPNDNG